MRGIFVFGSFIIFLLHNGSQINGQVLTLCEDPLLSTSCTLQCSRKAANESVRLYKDDTVKGECNGDGICTDWNSIYGTSFNSTTVKFKILKLEYANRGDWNCKSGERTGESKALHVYSFKRENVAYDIKPIDSRRYNLTVSIECVMPIPRVVVSFCEEQMCRGKGNAFFNGRCAYRSIQTHRRFSCILDFNFREAKCKRKRNEEPIQLSIMLDNHEVYAKETEEVFTYGNALSEMTTQCNAKAINQHTRDTEFVYDFLVVLLSCSTFISTGALVICRMCICIKKRGYTLVPTQSNGVNQSITKELDDITAYTEKKDDDGSQGGKKEMDSNVGIHVDDKKMEYSKV